MMNRDRVIYFTVLFSVFAACLAVYQFYFKAKLEKYAGDKALLQSLNTTYGSLNGMFKDEDPDTVISQYRSVVESWKDAIDARVPYFSDANWREHEKPPEDVFILQFWYGEQTRKMTLALWEKAQAKYGAYVYQSFPPDVQTMLGVAYAEQWQGYDISKELVSEQLERLSYGISIFELLMDNNAQQIRQVSIYEPQSSGFIGPDVEYARVGLSFVMEMKDLVEFIEELRMADRYFSIEGMQVTHPYIAMKYEPRMEVEMYLLRAKPKETFLAGADAPLAPGGAAGTPGLRPATAQQAYESEFVSPFRSPGAAERATTPAPEPTGFAKFWKWFKRTVLFTN